MALNGLSRVNEATWEGKQAKSRKDSHGGENFGVCPN